MASQNLYAEDDRLATPEVGGWAETKYRLVDLYARLFSTGMKNLWHQRVYIDLYAGAGFSRARGTHTFLKGSPILALTVPDPFDKYIFCEENEKLLSVLRARVRRLSPAAQATYMGNCDENVAKICAAIPKHSVQNKVLSLCVVDPFDFGMKFETLRKLSETYVDFLVLLAIGMDANRNYDNYVDGDSTKINEALGNSEWRTRWKKSGARRRDFRRFLAAEFSKSMESLNYLPQTLDQMKSVRSDDRNLPLYHLALFSRHRRAYEFWDDVLKYSDDQRGFDWQ